MGMMLEFWNLNNKKVAIKRMVLILLIIKLVLEVLEGNMGNVNTKDRTLFDFLIRLNGNKKVK
jgi:hypothetical protein